MNESKQMKLHISTTLLQRLAAFFLNIGIIAGLSALTISLVSCGGGGGSGGNSTPVSTTPTITSITPLGIVASSVPQAISILGTNFASGMTVSISGSGISTINITPSSTSSTVIAGNATINTVPIDNFVTVTVRATDSTPLASTVMGVASADKRVATGTPTIQYIFDTKCATCHTGSSNVNNLDLRDATLGNSTGVIGISSVSCSSKFRVVPGDPRRTNSVLIDRISAAPASQSCNTNKPMPPVGSPALTPQEITDLINWVAGGAN